MKYLFVQLFFVAVVVRRGIVATRHNNWHNDIINYGYFCQGTPHGMGKHYFPLDSSSSSLLYTRWNRVVCVCVCMRTQVKKQTFAFQRKFQRPTSSQVVAFLNVAYSGKYVYSFYKKNVKIATTRFVCVRKKHLT